jgi:hypothetical protein
MFGTHWVRMQGTIVAAQVVRTTGDGMVSIREYAVDVRTPEGEVFRARVHEPRLAMDFLPPAVGAVVGVEVDPRTRQVRFDKDDPTLSSKAAKQARGNAVDDALDEPPDTAG